LGKPSLLTVSAEGAEALIVTGMGETPTDCLAKEAAYGVCNCQGRAV
jgi:hypothetical protein